MVRRRTPARLPSALAASLITVAAISAQNAVWRLPTRGFADYQRKLTAVVVQADTKKDTKLEPNNLRVFYQLPAAGLCQSELDARQRSVAATPIQIRDLARWLAFDLRTLRPGAVKVELPRVLPFGDLRITGKASKVGPRGSQQLVLKITSRASTARGTPKKQFRDYVEPHFAQPITGTLGIDRTFDAERGAITSFNAALRVTMPRTRALKEAEVQIDESWQLRAVRANRDAQFNDDVSKAIDRGAAWGLKWLERLEGKGIPHKIKDGKSYDSGRLALVLLMLVKAEVDPNDSVLELGFDELRRRELTDSYSLACAIMALESFHAPAGERDDLLMGIIDKPRIRKLSAKDKAMMQTWVDRLLANIDQRVDSGYRVRFNYVPGRRYDNSVSQYALLGLYSAMLCGIDVSAGIWRGAANHFLADQRRLRVKPIRLELGGHDSIRVLEAAATKATRASMPMTDVAGWTYSAGPSPAYGSMTAAGITGLTICEAGLHGLGMGDADILPKIDRGIREGFAWFATNFSVRHHAGNWPQKAFGAYPYYMYSLERACELSGIGLIGARDWYFEGSLQLLPMQRKNGAFSAGLPDTTCFAVLFLKKAALPVATGRRTGRARKVGKGR